ncbi:glycosyltransferase [Sphingomonas antarctica]|uniref:glycosyltransferase n=1 Tax=Sphingomonas antarctica TaxID=2040274 RepID=UPI0039ECB9A0
MARCLEALARQTHADFDVVVCENGGAEATAATQAALPTTLAAGQAVEVIDGGGNIGFAGGCNVGMRARPDATAWWILNPDTEPSPGALAALVARLARGDVDATGGVLHFEDERVQGCGGQWHGWAGRPVSIGYGLPVTALPDAAEVEGRQNYLLGASMLVSPRFLALAGPMREDYFLYCEEVEWCLRARARGLKLGFAPEALVLHRQGAVTGSNAAMRSRPKLPIYLDERNKVNVTRDVWPARVPVAFVLLIAQLLLKFVRRGAWAQAGYAWQGLCAGLRDERGPPDWLSK